MFTACFMKNHYLGYREFSKLYTPLQQALDGKHPLMQWYLKELGQLKQALKFRWFATVTRSVQQWQQWQFLHFFRNLWFHFCLPQRPPSDNRNNRPALPPKQRCHLQPRPVLPVCQRLRQRPRCFAVVVFH